MATYIFMTNKDLSEQALVVNKSGTLSLEKGTTQAMDPRLLQKAQAHIQATKSPPRRVFVGYDGTIASHQDPRGANTPVSFGHILLAKILSETSDARQASHLVDLGCGTGLVGNHAAKNFEGTQGGKASDLIWEDRETFNLYNDNFIKSIQDIAISIENEDSVSLMENFNIMASNCGTCHKKFRN